MYKVEFWCTVAQTKSHHEVHWSFEEIKGLTKKVSPQWNNLKLPSTLYQGLHKWLCTLLSFTISTSHITVALATEEEESNQEDDTIFRRNQLQEQERHRRRHSRNTTSSGQEPPSDQLGWSIFSIVIVPYIGVAALIFSGLSIKYRIQGRVLTTVWTLCHYNDEAYNIYTKRWALEKACE